jgi:hypothetical protein
VCLAVLAVSLCPGAAPAHAGTHYVDGISDQSLPSWDGSFSSSSFVRSFRATWAGQIALARYALQWNAMSEASRGPNPAGDYRERFEAWLEDVRSLGLAPVLALTSYTHVYPGSAGGYEQELETLLDGAASGGEPIGYVEAWNEPNNQGGESARKAGEIANWAHSVCERRGCQVIAGDLEDSPPAVAYEQAYISALSFAPGIWGIHPYYSVKAHSDSPALRLEQALPDHGAGAQIWFTEIGAYYCAGGKLRGDAQQASDASYLINGLIPAIGPTHVFYYGFMAGEHAEVPCTASGGYDTELYRASGQPRSAANVVLRAAADPPLIFESKLTEEPLAFAPGSS